MKKSEQPVVIVTGSGSGIGKAVALGLGIKGYRIALVGRSMDSLVATGKELDKLGADWIPVQADIGNSAGPSVIFHQVKESMGRIDGVINNAGLCTCKSLEDLDEAEIAALYAINAIGPTNLVRVLLHELIRTRGCVINVASMAIVDPYVGLGVYGCTKSAIDALTRVVHNEYGEQGVRAFTVAPGAVETRMLRSIVSTEMLPTAQTLTPESVAKKIIDCITGELDEPSGSTIFMNSP
jgi:short-subunit dehydrogenase